MTNEPIESPDARQLREAGQRVSDAVRLQLTVHGVHAIGKWVACALSDGRSDGVLYDTKGDAVAHQLHEQWAMYVCIPAELSPADAASLLRSNRQLRETGYRLADPDRQIMWTSPPPGVPGVIVR